MMRLLRAFAFVLLVSAVIVVSGVWNTLRTWYNATYPTGEYAQACKSAGTTFLQSPRTPVRSVALDYSPASAAREWRHYEVTSNLVTQAGSTFWVPRMESQLDQFELRDELFARFPASKPFLRWDRAHPDRPVNVDQITSDVLVLDTVSNVGELKEALWKQGVVAHHLIVTDRRNGDQLATMSYVLDLKNGRACGANLEDAIDVDAFVLKATRVPIIVPEYERKRLANVKAYGAGMHFVVPVLLFGAIGYWFLGRKRVQPPSR